MSYQGRYFYGIIEEPQFKKFEFSGVGGEEVYTTSYQNLSAVVSNIEVGEIDPIRKNVLAHTVVQDEVLKIYDLLPMGFGMITNSGEEVMKLLEKNYQTILKELNRLKGKIEGEVKIFWDEEAIMRELQNENPKFSKLKAKIREASSPVEAQNLLAEAGRLIEHIAMEWKTKYAERAYNILKDLSIEAKLNEPFGVKNILNASFLLERTMENKFKEEIYRLDSEYQDRLDFKYVGPLPPYNFVKVKLEL